MTIYAIALFVHILGTLGLFVALGLEWTGLRALGRATTAAQAHERAAAYAILPRLYAPSAVAILLPGLYMTATAWGWSAGWPAVALAALVLLAVIGAALTGPRMAAIGRTAATESGSLSPALRQWVRDPILWTSVQTRAAIAVGVVFLMTVKPALGGALLTLGVAALFGLALAVPAWSPHRIDDRAIDPAA